MIMKHILVLLLISLFPTTIFCQTISGKFESNKNFKFTEKYWCVDGFGTKKMLGIEYTKNGILSSYKFKSKEYESWFSTEDDKTYLNIQQSKCVSCKPKKYIVKKLKVTWK